MNELHPVTTPAPSRDPHVNGLDAARTGTGVTLLILAGVAAGFIIDLLLPLGIAGGILYVAPLLLTMWLPAHRLALPVAAVATVLTIMGMLLSAPGAPVSAVLSNRGLAIAAIWTVAMAVFHRTRIESALHDSEATTRAILATTADGILTLDRRGKILTVNPALADIIGYGDDALTSQSMGIILTSTDADAFERDPDAWLQEAAADKSAAREIVVVRRTGEAIHVEINVVPLGLHSGTHYTITMRDISQRRLMEQHALRSSEKERRALGYGLHEELGQMLTGLQLMSLQLARKLESQGASEADDLRELANLIRDADELALKLFQDVVPVDARGGLCEALERMIGDIARQHEVAHSVDCANDLALADDAHAAQLYRVLHDLLQGLFECGSADRVHLQIDADGFSLHIARVSLSDAEQWRLVLDQLKYRASMIGMRLRPQPENEEDVVVTCVGANHGIMSATV